jgi:hypothetical protein
MTFKTDKQQSAGLCSRGCGHSSHRGACKWLKMQFTGPKSDDPKVIQHIKPQNRTPQEEKLMELARICHGTEDQPCTEKLHPLNHSGLCKRCYWRQHYRDKHPGKSLTPKAKRKSVSHGTLGPPCTVPVLSLTVTEAQVNTLLLGLPAGKKVALVQAHLDELAATL